MTKVNDRSARGVDYDPDIDAYRAEFDSIDTNASTAVVEAIAEVRHCDPMDLEPLYHSVDTDALDAIIAESTDGSVTVSFVADGLAIAVGADGTIEIEPPDIESI